MCVKWIMACTLRSDIIWLSPRLKEWSAVLLMCFDGCYVGKFLSILFFSLTPVLLSLQCVWKRGIINYNCLTKLEICLTVYQQHEISIESWCEIKWFIGFFIDIGLLLLRSFLRNVEIMDRQFPGCLGYYFTNVKLLYFWFLLFTVIEN